MPFAKFDLARRKFIFPSFFVFFFKSPRKWRRRETPKVMQPGVLPFAFPLLLLSAVSLFFRKRYRSVSPSGGGGAKRSSTSASTLTRRRPRATPQFRAALKFKGDGGEEPAVGGGPTSRGESQPWVLHAWHLFAPLYHNVVSYQRSERQSVRKNFNQLGMPARASRSPTTTSAVYQRGGAHVMSDGVNGSHQRGKMGEELPILKGILNGVVDYHNARMCRYFFFALFFGDFSGSGTFFSSRLTYNTFILVKANFSRVRFVIEPRHFLRGNGRQMWSRWHVPTPGVYALRVS